MESARSSRARPSVFLVASLGAVAMLDSCSTDVPTAPAEEQAVMTQMSDAPISVCHGSGIAGKVIDVPSSQLAIHLSHGDYIAHLVVNHNAGQREDGVHFHRIGDALAAARAGRLKRGELKSAACRILITVADGAFRGSALRPAGRDLDHLPFIVDVPNITLRGALVMRLDAAGRATGNGVGPNRTTIRPVDPMPFEDAGPSVPIILANGHPGGSAGNDLTVEGFVFTSGHDTTVDMGGQAVFSIRVKGLVIRGNRFEEGFSETIDLRATSAVVERNHLGGTQGTCDMCLAGPGTYRVTGNRLLAGGIPGITVSPTVGLAVPGDLEPYDLPAEAEVWAELRNNEVRDHLRIPTGVGIRTEAIGIGAPDVHGITHVGIHENSLVNNRFALLFHGGFPEPDTKLKGDVDVKLGGNEMRQSCQANLLVALVRHRDALGLDDLPYIEHSTYRVQLGGNLLWKDAWFGNEAGHGNRLIVDGRLIPNGTRQFYSETSCPRTNLPAAIALGVALAQ